MPAKRRAFPATALSHNGITLPHDADLGELLEDAQLEGLLESGQAVLASKPVLSAEDVDAPEVSVPEASADAS